MKLFFISLILVALFNCSVFASFKIIESVDSPNRDVKINFLISENGEIAYNVLFKNQKIIDTSTLGFIFKNMPPIKDNVKVIATKKATYNNKWEMPFGENLQKAHSYVRRKRRSKKAV